MLPHKLAVMINAVASTQNVLFLTVKQHGYVLPSLLYWSFRLCFRSLPTAFHAFRDICVLPFWLHQISDRSQPQHAAVRLGVRREHLRGSAAAVSAHAGGGGHGRPRPRRLYTGEEKAPAVPPPPTLCSLEWWLSCLPPTVLHLRWLLRCHLVGVFPCWGLQTGLYETLQAGSPVQQSSWNRVRVCCC